MVNIFLLDTKKIRQKPLAATPMLQPDLSKSRAGEAKWDASKLLDLESPCDGLSFFGL
jgi:hypothetical protein